MSVIIIDEKCAVAALDYPGWEEHCGGSRCLWWGGGIMMEGCDPQTHYLKNNDVILIILLT